MERRQLSTACVIRVQRVYLDYSQLVVGVENAVVLSRAIGDLAKRFDMSWRLAYRGKLKRVALVVGLLDHCLYDLLIRWRTGARVPAA